MTASMGQPGPARAADLGLPFAGVYIVGHDTSATQRASDVGAGMVVIQFAWADFEPTPTGTLATPTATTLDAMVASAVAKGLTPVAVVAGGPAWATVMPFGALKHDQDAAFLTFVDNLVSRYSAQGLHHWMLWPEPDAVQYPAGELQVGSWGDEPEWYADVMKRASTTIKSRDPSGKLILGPLAHDRFNIAKSTDWCRDPQPYNCGGIFSYEFLDKVLAVPGAAAAFDALAINAYAYYGAAWESGQNGRDVGAKVRHVQSRLVARGVDLPIVIGESGVWSSGDGWIPIRLAGGLDGPVTSSALQAAYPAQLFARARDAGAVAVIWFTLDEIDSIRKYGLFDDSLHRKDAFTTYRQAATALASAGRPFSPRTLVTVVSGYVEQYGFSDDSGNVTLLVWAANDPTDATQPPYRPPTAQIAIRDGFQAFDQIGSAIAPVGKTNAGSVYALTGNPVYLRGKGYRAAVPRVPRQSGT